jgi:hypothetical protein
MVNCDRLFSFIIFVIKNVRFLINDNLDQKSNCAAFPWMIEEVPENAQKARAAPTSKNKASFSMQPHRSHSGHGYEHLGECEFISNENMIMNL